MLFRSRYGHDEILKLSYYTTTVTLMKNFVNIPIKFQNLLLPDKNISILEFLQITIPPIPLSTKFGRIDDYITEDDPDPIDIQQIQRAGLPPATILKSLHMIPAEKFSTTKSIKVPHLPALPRFPMWILSYWINLSEVHQLQLQRRNEIGRASCRERV